MSSLRQLRCCEKLITNVILSAFNRQIFISVFVFLFIAEVTWNLANCTALHNWKTDLFLSWGECIWEEPQLQRTDGSTIVMESSFSVRHLLRWTYTTARMLFPTPLQCHIKQCLKRDYLGHNNGWFAEGMCRVIIQSSVGSGRHDHDLTPGFIHIQLLTLSVCQIVLT